jgi:4-hydroxyphenylalkanoate synthase
MSYSKVGTLGSNSLDANARSGGLPSLFSGLARRPRRRLIDDAADAAKSPSALAHRLSGLSSSEQHEFLVGTVCSEAATVLGHPAPEDINPDAAFQDFGLDSLTAVELRNRLKPLPG